MHCNRRLADPSDRRPVAGAQIVIPEDDVLGPRVARCFRLKNGPNHLPHSWLGLIFCWRARANCRISARRNRRIPVFVLIHWSFPDFSYLFTTSGDLCKIPATAPTVKK